MREKGGKWVNVSWLVLLRVPTLMVGSRFEVGPLRKRFKTVRVSLESTPRNVGRSNASASRFWAVFSRISKTSRKRIAEGKGDYEVRYALVGPGQNMGMPREKLVVSKPVSIRKLAPKGIDEDASYDQSIFTNQYPETMMVKYPTAIKVGHALLSQGGWSTPFQYMQAAPGNIWQSRLTPTTSKSDVAYAIRHDKYEKEQVELRMQRIATFLNARPEFVHAAALRLELAGRLAGFGQFDEAAAQFELAMKAPHSPEQQKQGADFVKAMEVKRAQVAQQALVKDAGL